MGGRCRVIWAVMSSCDDALCAEALRVLPAVLLCAGGRAGGSGDEECEYHSEDCRDGEKPRVVIHNIVSTSVVHGSKMPIDLHELSMLLPCSSYDRRSDSAPAPLPA